MPLAEPGQLRQRAKATVGDALVAPVAPGDRAGVAAAKSAQTRASPSLPLLPSVREVFGGYASAGANAGAGGAVGRCSWG